MTNWTSIEHYREVAAKRVSDGYEGAAIQLAFALDYWHDAYTDARDYRNVWCGVVWC